MAIKLTDSQREISSMLEDALISQKLPLDCTFTNEDGDPIIKAKKTVIKKHVQAFVVEAFPDEGDDDDDESTDDDDDDDNGKKDKDKD